MELGKIPPQDIEAEQAVIGSMLTDQEAVNAAVETLKPEDFYREDNKIIYSALLNLYNKAQAIDIITLKSELSAMGKLDAIGGLEYIAELPEKVPTTSNVERYIKIVEEKSMLRNLIKAANDIIDAGYDQTEDVEDIMDEAEKKIFNVVQNKEQNIKRDFFSKSLFTFYIYELLNMNPPMYTWIHGTSTTHTKKIKTVPTSI